jgi:hypothetical protein
MLGRSGSRRVPPPCPIFIGVNEGSSQNSSTIAARIPAPVGVTSSLSSPEGTTGSPSSKNIVAGAGTGIRPCWLQVKPLPSGIGVAVTRVTPSASSPTATATMSTMLSTAPTSWNPTSSTGTPCTRASARAIRAKIPNAVRRTSGFSGASCNIRRISAHDRCPCS